MANPEDIAGRFFRRAEKLRTIARNVKDPDCRNALLAWAADYDRRADRALQAGKSVAPPSIGSHQARQF